MYLYDLGDLENVVQESMAKKAGDKRAAESLCEEAVGDCVLELGKTAFNGVHRNPRRAQAPRLPVGGAETASDGAQWPHTTWTGEFA